MSSKCLYFFGRTRACVVGSWKSRVSLNLTFFFGELTGDSTFVCFKIGVGFSSLTESIFRCLDLDKEGEVELSVPLERVGENLSFAKRLFVPSRFRLVGLAADGNVSVLFFFVGELRSSPTLAIANI